MERVSVPISPGRLINAVARIGYDPEVALADLIDNSVDAESKNINCWLLPEYHEEEGESDTISSYVIADNGFGMDRDALIGAFTLGTQREYSPHSLGKFGLGLKSAGLSLGNRIVMISKTREMERPLCAVLSLSQVQETGEYEIDLGEVPDRYTDYWGEYAPSSEQGTVLVIDELNENQPSYSRLLPYLERYCGVVYHLFLEDDAKPLSMRINNKTVNAKDPLFMLEATGNGPLINPEDWDGKKAHLLLDDHMLALTPTVNCIISATHLVHPPSFEAEGKRSEIRDEYLIETDPYTRRARHGFYVYRNKRVIVLAERFHGLISNATQAWALRGRLMFDEAADDILSLDVKKRHCQLPKEARSNLQSIIRTHQHASIGAWTAAGRKLQEKRRATKDAVANEGISSTPIINLDYAPGTDLTNPAVQEARRELLEEIGADTLENITDSRFSKSELEKRLQEKSYVIPVEGLKANAMWLPYPAVQHGAAQTLVNQSHSWISEAYAAAEEDARITIILHQLFTILARAELEVRSVDWPGEDRQAATKVLERFRRKASAIAEDLADNLHTELQKLIDGVIDLDENE